MMDDDADIDCIFVNIRIHNEQTYCPLFSCLPKPGIVKCVQSIYSHYNNQILCMLSFYRMTLYNEIAKIEPNTLHTREIVNDMIRL